MRRGYFLLGCAATALGLLSHADRALANGRFPNAQQLIVSPNNPDRLWLRATHGVLTSADRGRTWRWICEEAVGYSGTKDPPIAVVATGAVLVGISGLSVSRDDGCQWQLDPTFGSEFIADLSVDRNDTSRVILLTSANVDGNYKTEVWRSLDAAVTWTRLSPTLSPTLVGLTLDAAPSDPRRLYVTGTEYRDVDGGASTQGKIYVSDDEGMSFTAFDIPGTNIEYSPYLAAVHPSNRDALYVRVSGPEITTGQLNGAIENFLLYSDDGGRSFREILRDGADFLGFALSPDGTNVLLGMGDSRTPGNLRPVDREVLGLYSSPAPAHAFTRLSPGHIGGLTFDGEELWLCTSQFDRGYELMRSADRGQTLEGISELTNLEGPVICPCETPTGARCPERWPRLCGMRGISRCSDEDADKDPKAKASCDGPPTPPSTPPPVPAPPPAHDGCGCRTPSRGTTITAALTIFALASISLFARRRRA
jgi:hypothetical protein